MNEPADAALRLRRRSFLAYFSAAGLGSTLFPGALWAMLQQRSSVTLDMIREAEQLAGLGFDDNQRQMVREGVEESLTNYRALRQIPLSNAVSPAVHFEPVPAGRARPVRQHPDQVKLSKSASGSLPDDVEDLCFWSVRDLAELLRTEQVTSVELTEMYLNRLKWFDDQLHCVITLTEELAMRQAEQADEEIAAGKYRGPLHGIPWGAKDLFHTRGIPTTYGAKPFESQVMDDDATVVTRLRDAGAVLLGKLSLGALAMGDVWFQGEENRTRNPWNLKQGSSGSSAGSACATAAGLAAFTLGTETLGSIVSPSRRCGVTGLRPTYGRVSRAGAMALSWSMDKVGPLARTVEDCALVFAAIHGADPRDVTSRDAPFDWNPDQPLESIRVGYLADVLEGDEVPKEDRATVAKLRELGIDLKPVSLPDLPSGSMMSILSAEAATAFDEITRNGQVDQLVRQDAGAWPNLFRQGQLIPAVEYLRANRVRTLLMERMAEVMEEVDVILAPSHRGASLMVTNLTGHPCVVLPNGFQEDGTPTAITFLGRLYGEADVLRVAKAYQDATTFHRQHPSLG